MKLLKKTNLGVAQALLDLLQDTLMAQVRPKSVIYTSKKTVHNIFGLGEGWKGRGSLGNFQKTSLKKHARRAFQKKKNTSAK